MMTLTEVESRTQGSRPRPRTQKKSEAKAKNQRHKCKCFPKKKVLKIFFRSISKKKKNGVEKHFSPDPQNFKHSKNSAVLESRTGQFSRTWGFEAKAKDLKMCPRGLHLWCISRFLLVNLSKFGDGMLIMLYFTLEKRKKC